MLEALLLVIDTPVTADALAAATEQPVYRVAAKLQLMADELTGRDSGIDLRHTSEGWRMYTRARFAPYVEKLLLDGARTKLTGPRWRPWPWWPTASRSHERGLVRCAGSTWTP